MIGLERDITNAIKLQAEDENVMKFVELKPILDEIVQASDARIELLKQLSDQEDGSFGAVVKEGITAVAGTLAGIYGKMREHPVSRIVRDDIIVLDLASVSYGMLLTLGLAIGHEQCTAIASRGVKETPPFIMELTKLLPMIVAKELSEDAPLANTAASQIAGVCIRDAWHNV